MSVAGDPQFVLLKPSLGWVDASQWTDILGSAVRNCWSPRDEFVPDKPLKYNTERLTELTLKNCVFQMAADRKKATELSIRGLFSLRGSTGDLNQVNLSGKLIELKRIESRSRFWKKIKSDPNFVLQVSEWLEETNWLGQPRDKVYWIAGLLICQDVTIVTSEEEVKARMTKGELPIGTVAELVAAGYGYPLNTGSVGNLTAERSQTTLTGTCFAGTGAGKYIFALEPKRIQLKGGQLEVTNEAPKNRRLGPGAVLKNVATDLDDLYLGDLDEDEWTKLLETSADLRAATQNLDQPLPH